MALFEGICSGLPKSERAKIPLGWSGHCLRPKPRTFASKSLLCWTLRPIDGIASFPQEMCPGLRGIHGTAGERGRSLPHCIEAGFFGLAIALGQDGDSSCSSWGSHELLGIPFKEHVCTSKHAIHTAVNT